MVWNCFPKTFVFTRGAGIHAALSEIALIVLAVKLDNSLVPSTPEEIKDTLKGLISLLEKGTGVPAGTLGYISIIIYTFQGGKSMSQTSTSDEYLAIQAKNQLVFRYRDLLPFP